MQDEEALVVAGSVGRSDDWSRALTVKEIGLRTINTREMKPPIR